MLSNVDLRIVNGVLDATDTFAILNFEIDVAVVAPFSTPGILNDPILCTLILPVSDKEYSMVNLTSTFWIVEYTLFVMHHLFSLDVSCHGTMLGESSFYFIGIIFATIMNRDCLNLCSLFGIISAFFVFTSIVILAFSHHIMILEIIHGYGRTSSKTAIPLIQAINEYLFRDRHKFAFFDSMGTLKCTGCSK